jgi:hypothetical protein
MFGVLAAGAPAVLVFVKTVLDFRGHWREHRSTTAADDADDSGASTAD